MTKEHNTATNQHGNDLLLMSLDRSRFIPATNAIIIKHEEAKESRGLKDVRVLLFLMLWYFFSFCTLFLNKYILSSLKADPTLLGAVQIMMTTTFGFLQMYLPMGFYKPVKREGKPKHFWKNMILVGTMRFSTVILGLVSLKYVAVSFTETVKSSAPLFTVFISRLLTWEITGFYTFMSLIPVMSGLALCSAFELSFNIQGFTAALATNLIECLQNVYSKLLMSGENYKYTPAELQFYTSIASMMVQIPVSFFLIDFPYAKKTFDGKMLIALILNGTAFHCQSLSAYTLMSYISPVTHSVANTVKRAFLILISVIVFGNSVTFFSGLGTVIVTVGVLCYIKAKEYDSINLVKQAKFESQEVRVETGSTR
ncbi:hypothetical protein ACJMK2_008585 [Sinanodonta woodiana]|uniref:Sugar phosphate transporter domain-containing protein n=1 Tax=Sinanodonta woodiana TaxID=1069815 RepID=A0ABD3VND4_SINWO